MTAATPATTPSGAALVARLGVLPGETLPAAWTRHVRAALAGRSRAAAAAQLGVTVRTVARWVAWLDAEGGGAPVGVRDRDARGPGSCGGTSPATRSKIATAAHVAEERPLPHRAVA